MTSEKRRAQQAEAQRKWARNHPEKHSAMVKKWEQDNPERAREIHRKSLKKLRTKLREEAITLLGSQCVQCQCNDIRCLQIDHIIPCKGKRLVAYQFYRSIVQGQTENLQVLCANCHAIKTYCEYDEQEEQC